MIRHVVLWRFRQAAGGGDREQNRVRASAMLESLRGSIPAIRELEVGRNFTEAPEAWDLGLVVTVETEEDLAAYIAHPEHRKVAEYLGSVALERAAVDYYV